MFSLTSRENVFWTKYWLYLYCILLYWDFIDFQNFFHNWYWSVEMKDCSFSNLNLKKKTLFVCWYIIFIQKYVLKWLPLYVTFRRLYTVYKMLGCAARWRHWLPNDLISLIAAPYAYVHIFPNWQQLLLWGNISSLQYSLIFSGRF